MNARFKNPYFVMAVAAFLYQVLMQFDIHVDAELYRNGVDLLSYALIGTGIYKTFNVSVPAQQQDNEKKDANHT